MPVDFFKKVSRSEAGIQAVQLRYQGSYGAVVIEIEAPVGFLVHPPARRKLTRTSGWGGRARLTCCVRRRPVETAGCGDGLSLGAGWPSVRNSPGAVSPALERSSYRDFRLPRDVRYAKQPESRKDREASWPRPADRSDRSGRSGRWPETPRVCLKGAR